MNAQPEILLQAYKQAPWRIQLQWLGYMLAGIVLLGLIGWVYTDITARSGKVGREIQAMQSEILAAQRTNSDLETQIARLTSISTMKARANELGFHQVSSREVTYLAVEGYYEPATVVLAAPPGPVVAPNETLPSEYTQSLFSWVQKMTLHPEGLAQEFGVPSSVGVGGIPESDEAPGAEPGSAPGEGTP
jgi:hypothetical protein